MSAERIASIPEDNDVPKFRATSETGERALSVGVALRYCQRQMSEGLGRWSHLDLDVVAEAVQAVHQLAFRQVCKIAAHHVGYLRLSEPHAFRGYLLSQLKATYGLPDFND